MLRVNLIFWLMSSVHKMEKKVYLGPFWKFHPNPKLKFSSYLLSETQNIGFKNQAFKYSTTQIHLFEALMLRDDGGRILKVFVFCVIILFIYKSRWL